MNKALAFICFFSAFVIMGVSFPDGMVAMVLLCILTGAAILILRLNAENSDFLINIFILALLARVLFATISHVFEIEGFFGGDQFTYDDVGGRLVEVWMGRLPSNDVSVTRAINPSSAGWGMYYITAIIYLFCGKNMLAGQFFCSVIGAATAPMVYVCAHEVYNNHRVSKISAILVAFFPAFIVWSSQLLKDSLIIFLLVLAITMVLKLQKKLGYLPLLLLAFSLFGVLALRFYIFYIVAAAVAGSFIIGRDSSMKSIIRGFVTMVLIGAILTYIGALQSAGSNLEKYGTMERMQASRLDNARTANSGFNEDIDVSTPLGAIEAMPLGFTYLMFAPFPWQVSNIRQAVTLPEMLIWWLSIPILISGLWFTIKTKLRQSVSILLFTVLLTIAYSVFQGNVGTAYRQRAQIQVFLFIFIAVGWTLIVERRENSKLSKNLRRLHKHRLSPEAKRPDVPEEQFG